MQPVLSDKFSTDGFDILDSIYSPDELKLIVQTIEDADDSGTAFRKTSELFAIRRFLTEVPQITTLIFNERLKTVIAERFGEDYFSTKSIYFDKPERSNWFVGWHQDLTISVTNKADIPGYALWTKKPDQYAVQPPLDILNKNVTIRIHLDDTNEGNGALRVIAASHLAGICRSESIDITTASITSCDVKAGGIMLMRPLLMHSSNRTSNSKKRRVIHIEFSNQQLPEGINWAEAHQIH